jgi:lipopolysaccharide transport protein LptA
MALLLAAAALPPGPVDFKAQDMRIEPRGHRVYLDGDVHLVRGDLTVTGEHAIAEYKAGDTNAARGAHRVPKGRQSNTTLGGEAVDKFTVDGKVHVEQGTRTADGDRGVLDVPAQTMVLTGTPEMPPVVRDGSETLSGERIVLRLDNDDIVVQGPKLVLKRSLPSETQKSATTPVRVEAAHLEVLKEKHLAQFRDNVVVRRGDAVVRSPRMDARYDKDGQLTKLEMRGGVDLKQGDRRATGQKADYDAVTKMLVLTGDPRLYDRGDVLAGDRIDMALDSKEVRVEKAKGRLHPEAHKDEARQ